MTDTSRDIFDLLGISTRENAYSALIAGVLEHDAGSRTRALAHLSGLDAHGIVSSNVDYQHALTLTKKSRVIPDILLKAETSSGPHWLVIEVKLHAGESTNQCSSYRTACEFAQEKKLCSGHQVALLTLDGVDSSAEDVRAVSHRELAEVMAPDQNALPAHVKLAWAAYVQRLQHFESLPGPAPTDEVFAYLGRSRRGFIRSRDLADKLAFALFPSGRWQTSGSTIRNKVVLQAWGPRDWQGQETCKEANAARCFNAHLELQLPKVAQGTGTAYLAVHFETRPYMKEAELKTRAVFADFLKLSKRFTEELHRRLPDSDWAPYDRYLQKARTPIPWNEDITVAELSRLVTQAANAVRPAVEESLRTAVQ